MTHIEDAVAAIDTPALAASAMLLNLCLVGWFSVSRGPRVAPHNPISS
jgi:hypothetical protein